MTESKTNPTLNIGWAQRDLTPDQPVSLSGQFHARASEGVLDPITATVLAMEAGDPRANAIMISCDLVCISNEVLSGVRAALQKSLPELDPLQVVLNATHTHTAPETRIANTGPNGLGGALTSFGDVDLKVMPSKDYVEFAVRRIAEAVAKAWKSRTPSGVGFGLGYAVVGRNRRTSYYNGETRMYGKVNDPDFSHIEGYEDHAVNILGVWDKNRRLTGLVVNLACPAQVSEGLFQISADYWHETRLELRRRFGKDLFILAQCSAAGDQSPHLPGNECRASKGSGGRENAEVRMWRLAGRTQRQEIAVRIADAVASILPLIEKEIEWAPAFSHCVRTVELSRRNLTQKDVDEAMAEAVKANERYESLRRDLEAHPEKKQTPRWYMDVTTAYRRARWNESVKERFEAQKRQPRVPVEIHVLRLGDMAFATNPFEYYLDYGMQIKARSKAVQTFLVQLAGYGTYLPSPRAVAGKSYGAIPASTPIGPEGGRELVEATLKSISELWQ